jgi:branched-chain amino acid transport system permease protein
MLPYIFSGLALGSIYAIVAAGLVVTYTSTGILNFAFGAMAFFVGRFFYWTHTERGWSLVVAALVSLLVVAPLFGMTLYLAVFRALRNRPTLIKIVSTIGLSVAIPAATILIFGNIPIAQPPGLAPLPEKYWHVFGAAVTLDQIIVYSLLIVIVGIGTAILRLTDIGLKVRALVESPALTELSGTNPNRLALGVWAVSGLLAGVAGILVAPTIGLSISSMTLLMAGAFVAVVAARLRNLGTAVGIALLVGIVTDVIQFFLPSQSALTSDIAQSVPFLFMCVFLVSYLVRGGLVGQESGGALDNVLRSESTERGGVTTIRTTAAGNLLRWYSAQTVLPLIPLLLVFVVPVFADGYWLGLIASGFALAVVFLAISLVAGEGGMIWLCQITFAGGGALLAAELNMNSGVSPLLAAVIGGLAMVPIGMFIGALTIMLGELYVALTTLTFGILVDELVFSNSKFNPGLGGVTLHRPSFAIHDRGFAYLCIGVLVILGLFIVNMRRSTTGLALSAVRWSDPGSRTLGLKTVRLKIVLAGFAAFVAGLGGALLAMFNTSADPSTYNTFTGLVWLAVLVTIGIRSITAAVIAGLAFAVLPGVFATYLPITWAQVPAILFGLGAVAVAVHPEGVVAHWGGLLRGPSSRRRAQVVSSVVAQPDLVEVPADADDRVSGPGLR